ncbi:mandelate racemase/muconate lactonizing enzyme family protein [Shimia abyssi]|uniref:L-alanine-DL-glutamate epimerase-like enolase superfamily enzyme n=1 Tax=Shimia abyssi TaxID=1662395 RepID=A0A2P8FCB7_9RHOB|nr:mandelate racemase/muconate lactonizing enzyme family protein [Shimia abyssi]PSL19371.1 L-alanine-DL-glutamate epimerase-like enolase superfamily enzyme [Shimia abyssi]
MRVKSVQAWWIQFPIETLRQHVSDFGRLTTFDAAIVRIETDDGLIGWGEGKNAAGSAGFYGTLVHMINTEFGPKIIGRDPADVTFIWEDLYNGVRADKAKAHGHSMPDLARRGLSVAAISAIDIALWDILGKSQGAPVWKLLGGRKADRLPAYASGGWESAEHIGEQLTSYIDKGGFRAVKMRVGAMDANPHASAERVKAARRAIGPDVELMVDAHGTFSVGTARRFAEMVRDCDLAWFEEPISGDDKQGMAELRASTRIPIAAGESEATRFDFRDLATLRAVDIFQPDPGYAGGITECMRIGTLASTFNLGFAPHLWAGAPCFFAGLHICAASPASFTVEYSLGANPMIHDLAEETVAVSDGMIQIPETPGLGLSISDKTIKDFAVQG